MVKIILNIILIYTLSSQTVSAQYKVTDSVISIGLLVNNNTSLAATNAAELAIDIANKSEDLIGRRFKLVTRSMEGPWGAGSKEAVNLVFNEKAWAILGSHDSRNAHLAEQVIAKTKVVFLSAWASDPTLSQAYIPWFYNCVPNDIQQAEVLIKEIVKKEKFNKLAVITQENYDAKKALKYVKEQIQSVSTQDPYTSSFSFCTDSTEVFIKKLRDNAIETIVILGNQKQSWELMSLLRKKELKTPIFGTISMLGAQDLSQLDPKHLSNLTVLNSGNWMKSNTLRFQNTADKSNIISNAIAAYAFDGINVIINAIKSSSFDRDKFYETISETNYNGVTGKIKFEKNGIRMNNLDLVKIAN